MRIIISPAKKMNVDVETISFCEKPYFLERTEELMHLLQSLSYKELKAIWKCNDKIAELNQRRLREMNLHQNLTAALLAYEGIQYQYMAPQVFSKEQWEYVQEHLRILSGFYGILRPLDGVVPYRLEMQAKLALNEKKDLYAYWGETLYQYLANETDCILNLASKEYAKSIEKYLQPNMRMITCVFGEQKEGKIVQKATQAKMARGEMVRYLAEKGIEEPKQVQAFSGLDYSFSEEDSTEETFVFIRNA